MTAQLPSRSKLKKIIETADQIIAEMAKSSSSDEWAFLNDDMGTPSEVKALAEFALAAHEQEPVACEFAGWQAKKHGGNWVTIRKEDVNHYRFNEEVPVRIVFTAPQTVVPEGWEPCSPEWIERNGPCSCAKAPRIAFGPIGNHYHPHMYHNPAPVPAVPDEVPEWLKDKLLTICDMVEDNDEYCQDIWKACRAAMLNGGKS